MAESAREKPAEQSHQQPSGERGRRGPPGRPTSSHSTIGSPARSTAVTSAPPCPRRAELVTHTTTRTSAFRTGGGQRWFAYALRSQRLLDPGIPRSGFQVVSRRASVNTLPTCSGVRAVGKPAQRRDQRAGHDHGHPGRPSVDHQPPADDDNDDDQRPDRNPSGQLRPRRPAHFGDHPAEPAVVEERARFCASSALMSNSSWPRPRPKIGAAT
jgi:hypothetical protein